MDKALPGEGEHLHAPFWATVGASDDHIFKNIDWVTTDRSFCHHWADWAILSYVIKFDRSVPSPCDEQICILWVVSQARDDVVVTRDLSVLSKSVLLLASWNIVSVNFEASCGSGEGLAIASVIGGSDFVACQNLHIDLADRLFAAIKPILNETIRLNGGQQVLVSILVVSWYWIPSDDRDWFGSFVWLH